MSGRYGPYVQLGESESKATKAKPKRMSLPPGMEVEQVDLSLALSLLELPKSLGTHPTSGKEVKKGLGRFGPYVVHDGDFRSIPKHMDLFRVGLKEALELLAQPKRGRGRAAPVKELGQFLDTQDHIQVFVGKYGPYVKVGKWNASLPQGTSVEALTVDEAVRLIQAKQGAGGGTQRKRAALKPGTAIQQPLGDVRAKTQKGGNKKGVAKNKKTTARPEKKSTLKSKKTNLKKANLKKMNVKGVKNQYEVKLTE